MQIAPDRRYNGRVTLKGVFNLPQVSSKKPSVRSHVDYVAGYVDEIQFDNISSSPEGLKRVSSSRGVLEIASLKTSHLSSAGRTTVMQLL